VFILPHVWWYLHLHTRILWISVSRKKKNYVNIFILYSVRYNVKLANFIAQVIPSKFAADHLGERAHDIILRRPNRKEKWLVSYYYSCRTRCFNNLPLFKFMSENKLCEGDICVFELMKGKRRVTMTVHAIRKANDRFILVGYWCSALVLL